MDGRTGTDHTLTMGLNTRQRWQWVQDEIEKILSTHALFKEEPADVVIATEFAAPDQRLRIEREHCQAIASRLRVQLQEVGWRDLVEYITQKVFLDAEEEERYVLENSVLPYPKLAPLVVKVVKPYAEPGKPVSQWRRRMEAIQAAFYEPRRRRVNVWLTPFVQDAAAGQPGLARFVRSRMHGSEPEAVSTMIRMRKYAINKGVIGSAIPDLPGDITRFYADAIFEDLKVESIPDNLLQTVMSMLKSGHDAEYIRKMLKFYIKGAMTQDLKPSKRTLCGIQMEILDKHDPLVVRDGDINDSCMVWGGAAGSAVKDVILNPKSALLVASIPQETVLLATQETGLAEIMRKSRKTPSLEKKGYLAYCYVRICSFGWLILDNVEANAAGRKNPSLGPAIRQWVAEALRETGCSKALVGAFNSPKNLLTVPLVKLPRDFLEKHFPDNQEVYSDIQNPPGAWEILPD